MTAGHVFICHTPHDAAFAHDLALALESQNIPVWADTHQRRGTERLTPEVRWAIEKAQHVLFVLSIYTEPTAWVRREIEYAQEIERRSGGKYSITPLLLPGATIEQLAQWAITATPIYVNAQGLGATLPALLAVFHENLPSEHRTNTRQEELQLTFEAMSPTQQWTVTATVRSPMREERQRTWTMQRPLPKPPQTALLAWYWRDRQYWPTDHVAQSASAVESFFVTWGQSLYKATIGAPELAEIASDWMQGAHTQPRLLTLCGDANSTAIAALMGLPWEWLHDGTCFLAQGKARIHCQRRLLGAPIPMRTVPTVIPLRALVVSPRPDTEPTDQADDRRSALPLFDAVEPFGQLVQARTLFVPTFAALVERLKASSAAGRPFSVAHLDGDIRRGIQGDVVFAFEEPSLEETPPLWRAAEYISVTTLATLLATQGVYMVVLVRPHTDQRADLAARCAALFLDAGISAVLIVHPHAPPGALRHFWTAFYGDLLRGASIGRAAYSGQERLANDTDRAIGFGGTRLHWWDWPLAQLYLGQQDTSLVRRPPVELWRRVATTDVTLPIGLLPPLPETDCIGRSREWRSLQRLISAAPAILVRGAGGIGKTTWVTACVHWFVRHRRYDQAAYVRDTDADDIRTLLETLGQQLLPEGAHWSIEQYPTFWKALDYFRDTLHKRRILIVLDQLERWPLDEDDTTEAFWKTLLQDWPTLQLLGVSRVGPPPFIKPWTELVFRHLEDDDALLLVSRALAIRGQAPPSGDSGQSFLQLQRLIRHASGHPSALLSVAQEVQARGVRTTEVFLQWLKGQFREQARDSKWSLYLTLELKLRTLSPVQREWANILAFFKGGGAHRLVMGYALGVDTTVLANFCERLIAAELIIDEGHGHIRFDTALADYLGQQLEATVHTEWQKRWLRGMEQFISQVYLHAFKDSTRTRRLLHKELPNLLAFLRNLSRYAEPEKAAKLCSQLEQLLAILGPSAALVEVIAARERTSRALQHWSRTRFEIEQRRIERLCDEDAVDEALCIARQLLRRCQEAGTEAYVGAGYDIAHAHFILGKLLRRAHAIEPATQEFSEARGQFQVLAQNGNANASRMAAVAEAEAGDCLTDLKRLNEAAAAYEAALAREAHTTNPAVATNRLQLAGVRQRQGRYTEAVGLYEKARTLFESLGIVDGTAQAWKELGIAHKLNGALVSALHACQQALALYEQRHHLHEIAGILGEMGHLHQALDQLDDAVAAYRRMADLCMELGDRRGEEVSRNRLAYVLIQLRQHDDARKELYRASACNLPDSETARNWAIPRGLRDVSQMISRVDLAEHARQQAIQKYLAYRRAGGENTNPGARLCAQINQAIQEGHTEKLVDRIDQMAKSANLPDSGQLLLKKLRAILSGSRDPALATDPKLHYQYAAEIQLLLETLSQIKSR